MGRYQRVAPQSGELRPKVLESGPTKEPMASQKPNPAQMARSVAEVNPKLIKILIAKTHDMKDYAKKELH